MPVPQLDEPGNANRPENTFAVEDNDEGNTVYICFRQKGSGTRVFRIIYFAENAVKLYSDVGEFFCNLTGDTGISDIGKLTATLLVPEGAPDEDSRIWAHGPLNGTFEKQSDSFGIPQKLQSCSGMRIFKKDQFKGHSKAFPRKVAASPD